MSRSIKKCEHGTIVSRCRCPGPHQVEIVPCPPHCTHIDSEEVRMRKQLAAITAELEATKAKLAHRDVLLAKLEAWCRTGGKHYVPTPGSSDSFGDGVRQAQREVQAMVAVNLATIIAAAEQGGE